MFEMDDKTITDALDLTPMIKQTPSKLIVPKSSGSEDDIAADFKYTRENLYSAIDQGNQALEQMIDVARASEHPRAYEVVSTLMSTLVNANKDLLDLSKKKQELMPKNDSESPQTVNNNLFVGSTSELQKMLKDAVDDTK